MKTTVEIPDALLLAAKRRAHASGTSVRELVSEGLRRVLADDDHAGTAYRYEPVLSDGGSTLRPGVDLADWTRVRDIVYQDRGA